MDFGRFCRCLVCGHLEFRFAVVCGAEELSTDVPFARLTAVHYIAVGSFAAAFAPASVYRSFPHLTKVKYIIYSIPPKTAPFYARGQVGNVFCAFRQK